MSTSTLEQFTKTLPPFESGKVENFPHGAANNAVPFNAQNVRALADLLDRVDSNGVDPVGYTILSKQKILNLLKTHDQKAIALALLRILKDHHKHLWKALVDKYGEEHVVNEDNPTVTNLMILVAQLRNGELSQIIISTEDDPLKVAQALNLESLLPSTTLQTLENPLQSLLVNFSKKHDPNDASFLDMLQELYNIAKTYSSNAIASRTASYGNANFDNPTSRVIKQMELYLNYFNPFNTQQDPAIKAVAA